MVCTLTKVGFQCTLRTSCKHVFDGGAATPKSAKHFSIFKIAGHQSKEPARNLQSNQDSYKDVEINKIKGLAPISQERYYSLGRRRVISVLEDEINYFD